MELVYHIVAFDIMQRSPVSSHIKYMARTLCMNMDFNKIIALSHNHRLAPGFQSLSDLFSRQFAWTDDKLRAVWIFNGELLTLGFQSADDRFYFNINFLLFLSIH